MNHAHSLAASDFFNTLLDLGCRIGDITLTNPRHEQVFAKRWNVSGTAYGGSEETGGDPSVGSHDTTADT
jgi:hypothetical protein